MLWHHELRLLPHLTYLVWTADGLHLGLQQTEGMWPICCDWYARLRGADSRSCLLRSGLMNLCTAGGRSPPAVLRPIPAGCEVCLTQHRPRCGGTVKQFIGNHKEVFDSDRLERVCMNADNDGHLWDTKARMSHSRGDSACMGSQWHHQHFQKHTHTYLLPDKYKSWQRGDFFLD